MIANNATHTDSARTLRFYTGYPWRGAGDGVVNQMRRRTNSPLARFLCLATSLLVGYLRAGPAQNVVTSEQPVWFERLKNPQDYQRNETPLHYPLRLPKGAGIQVVTNSPANTQARHSYDERVIAAVRQTWLALLRSKNYDDAPIDFSGTNIMEFEVSVDGSVKGTTWVQKSGSKVMDSWCECAIKFPAGYGRWPDWQEHTNDAVRTFRITFMLPHNKN